MKRTVRSALIGLGLVTAAVAVAAQGGGGRRLYVQNGDLDDIVNVPYDGRLTFARVRFEPMGQGFGGRRGRDRKWDHDTPRAELHLMKILDELTTLNPFLDGGNIYAFDDPELTKYPIAYLCEVGFWNPTETEAQGMRDYLAKGGFIIVDDFIGGDMWYNFEQQMRRVLPELKLVKLDVSEPIFDSFFKINSLAMSDPNFRQVSEFWGMYEDNDPSKRLMMVVNFNNDIGDYWEWSDVGTVPIEQSNEAYKLGVNYVIYAMTH
jgi:hypothetical protein